VGQFLFSVEKIPHPGSRRERRSPTLPTLPGRGIGPLRASAGLPCACRVRADIVVAGYLRLSRRLAPVVA